MSKAPERERGPLSFGVLEGVMVYGWWWPIPLFPNRQGCLNPDVRLRKVRNKVRTH